MKNKKSAKRTIKKVVPIAEKAMEENLKRTKIRVIGVGGGGGAIVSEIALRMPKASFIAANTDLKALKSINKKVSLFQFGQGFTHGLGTGMSVDIGREAALADKEKITKLLEGQDLVILISCLGGGAGSGAVPIFAKISNSLGNLTYGIFTLPLSFEGEKKMEIAKDSLKRVKNYLNAITLIPNERVFQIIDKNTPLKGALSAINQHLAQSLGGLIETIYEPGLINIDFADLRTILEGNGRIAYLNTVEVSRKEGAVKELLEKVLNSPLYPYTLRGAKGVIFNIVGEKKLSLAEVSQISRTIFEMTNPEAKIIFGISQNSKYSDSLKTTILATGCSMKPLPGVPEDNKPEKEVKRVPRIKKVEIKQKKEKPKKKKTIKKILKKRPLLETKPEEKKEEEIPEETLRKNGLQVKKEVEEMEKEMLEREDVWEKPAFIRRDIPIN